MRELIGANPEAIRANQVYFYQGILLRFVETIKNSKRSYWVFEPIQGQSAKALVRLKLRQLQYDCFEVPGYTCQTYNQPSDYIQPTLIDYLKEINEQDTKQDQTQHLVVDERSQQGTQASLQRAISSNKTQEEELLSCYRKLLPEKAVGDSLLRCQHLHPEILFLQWVCSYQRTYQADCGSIKEAVMKTQTLDKLERIERLLGKQIATITNLTSKQQLSKARREIICVINNQLTQGVEHS